MPGVQEDNWASYFTSLAPSLFKKGRAFLWQRFFKCLCFSRKSSYQMKSCTKPQYIKQPKSELAALAEAMGVGGWNSAHSASPSPPQGALRNGTGGLRLQGT